MPFAAIAELTAHEVRTEVADVGAAVAVVEAAFVATAAFWRALVAVARAGSQGLASGQFRAELADVGTAVAVVETAFVAVATFRGLGTAVAFAATGGGAVSLVPVELLAVEVGAPGSVVAVTVTDPALGAAQSFTIEHIAGLTFSTAAGQFRTEVADIGAAVAVIEA